MTTLLHLGVRFLEEDESDYILIQGGWVSFKHAMEEAIQACQYILFLVYSYKSEMTSCFCVKYI